MRIGIISDLHVDEAPEGEVLAALAARTSILKPDTIIIPGDLSSSWRTSLRLVEDLEDLTGLPVFFVPGNHDLWNRDHPEENAQTATAALGRHPGCLSGRRISFRGWNLLGETGWYDSSFAEGRFSSEEISLMAFGGRTWQDSLYTRWPEPMEARCRLFMEALGHSLEGLDASRTIVVTHVVPRIEFTVRPPEGIWTYFNALLGSASYGAMLAARGVRASLFGHVHYRSRMVLDGVEWICPCLGTRNEWKSGDTAREVAEAFAILDLGD